MEQPTRTAITRDTGRVLCEAEVVHRGGTIRLIIPANDGRTSGNGNGNGGAP